MDQATVRRRLHALRERRRISQVELSHSMGFNDRQTLSDIELGKRSISADELIRAAKRLRVQPDYFTDPLELAGEATFSWRKTTSKSVDLEAFEARAGQWIATYRHLTRLKGESVNSSLTRVGITAKSSFEEAAAEGEAVARSLDLGAVPALNLARVLEEKLDTLVLLVDTVPGVSGAACQVGALNAIIINRQEAEARRSFDLGHELFHLLTWDQLKPPHVEGAASLSPRQKRIEQLADNFSAGLLMPGAEISHLAADAPLPPEGDALVTSVRKLAAHFRVSGPAMKWRLADLGLIARAVASRIDDAALGARRDGKRPACFSRRFASILRWGVAEGHLTVRKAASIVGLTIDGLRELFAEHGLKPPFDL